MKRAMILIFAAAHRFSVKGDDFAGNIVVREDFSQPPRHHVRVEQLENPLERVRAGDTVRQVEIDRKPSISGFSEDWQVVVGSRAADNRAKSDDQNIYKLVALIPPAPARIRDLFRHFDKFFYVFHAYIISCSAILCKGFA
jgi:hypothetical protein